MKKSITIKIAGKMLDERSDSDVCHLPPHYRSVPRTLNLISIKSAEAALGNAVVQKRCG